MQQNISRKVTVSLPEDLVTFADAKADERGTTRSRLIGGLLAELRMREEDSLAKEGYRFYAREANEFSEMTSSAVAEALHNDRPTR